MIAVDTLTPGYYRTLPRNMARKHKQPGQHQPRQHQSRNNSVEGSMDQVDIVITCQSLVFRGV